MRASMDALRELLSDKLRNHHRNVGTLGCSEALAERKRVCRELGLLRKEDQNMVNSLYEPLPAARVVTSLEEDEEDNALFVTQQTPPCVPQTTPPGNHSPASPKPSGAPPSEDLDDCAKSEQLLRMHGTKRRKDISASQKQLQNKRAKTNTILSYFSHSQK